MGFADSAAAGVLDQLFFSVHPLGRLARTIETLLPAHDDLSVARNGVGTRRRASNASEVHHACLIRPAERACELASVPGESDDDAAVGTGAVGGAVGPIAWLRRGCEGPEQAPH